MLTKEASLKEYASLKIKMGQMTERLDELKPLILADMVEENLDKIPTSMGDFTLTKRKTWSYSDDVKLLDDGLKKAKAIEEADGTATFVETPILVFKENKEE